MSESQKVVIELDTSLFVQYDGQGPLVVMVAGLGDDHTLFDPLVAEMSGGFTCLTYDHRGSGASSPLPDDAEIATLAEDGHRLLEELGHSQAIGLGCSMGGTVVQEWALRHPDDFSRLILISTYARPDRYVEGRVRHWQALYESGRTDLLIESMALLALSPACWDRDPALAAELLAADTVAPGFISQLRACLAHDAVERLGSVCQPTLVIGGRDDLIVPFFHAEQLAELIPDATLRIFSSGHVPFWENPAEIAAEISAFCD
jgi:3-oxoadipate enol-lactonase